MTTSSTTTAKLTWPRSKLRVREIPQGGRGWFQNLSQAKQQDDEHVFVKFCKKYIFDGVEYAPLMYKVIMHLTTINSIATTQMLRDNLQFLSVFAAMV